MFISFIQNLDSKGTAEYVLAEYLVNYVFSKD